MTLVKINPSERTPEVDFDFNNDIYILKGESYPEDVTSFYGSLLEKLEARFKNLSTGSIQFIFELVYFNSSTAKIIMNLFEMLEECATRGATVHIVWKHEEDDDNMQELGEEFGEDLEHAVFSLEVIRL